MSDHQKRKTTAGIVLILVGLGFFLISEYGVFESEYILLILGLAFIAAYLWRKRYGLLVPGGILTGLGLGGLLDDTVSRFGDGEQLGLGIGFIAVYGIALAYEGRSHWWPLIPGGILVLSGLEQTEEVARFLFDHWPLMLVVIGVLLIVGGMRGGSDGGAKSGRAGGGETGVG